MEDGVGAGIVGEKSLIIISNERFKHVIKYWGDNHQETKPENFKNGCLGRMQLAAGTGKSRNGCSHKLLPCYMHFFDKSKSLLYW